MLMTRLFWEGVVLLLLSFWEGCDKVKDRVSIANLWHNLYCRQCCVIEGAEIF